MTSAVYCQLKVYYCFLHCVIPLLVICLSDTYSFIKEIFSHKEILRYFYIKQTFHYCTEILSPVANTVANTSA